MPGPINASGLIPTRIASTITAEALQQSVVLRLGNRVPMPAGVSVVPVPKTFPKASWISTGARKPFTDFTLGTEQLVAEEVAAVISIPDVYLDDVDINLWNYSRPLLAEAIAVAVDDAVLWGTDAPATFPAGGIVAGAATAAPGIDAVATINNAMSLVEGQGLRDTGSAADLTVQGMLRGVRDAAGALLLGPADVSSGGLSTLYGVPIAYSSFPADAPVDLVTGDWTKLLIGVRQDIRYQLSSEGVVADDTGKVVISAFQDNQTLMKVWARYAVTLIKPVTRRVPTGANPFAKADLSVVAPPATMMAEEPPPQRATASTAKKA